MRIKNTVPIEAIPDHFQKSVVSNNRSKLPNIENVMNNLKKYISLDSIGLTLVKVYR